jgi:ribonuclease HI
MVFHCSMRPPVFSWLRDPGHDVEAKLFCRFTEVRSDFGQRVLDEHMLRDMTEHMQGHNSITVATDGGADDDLWIAQGSAWGAALETDGVWRSWGGRIRGLDATPLLAEMWAALHVREAAAAAGVEVLRLVIDNSFVMESMGRIATDQGRPLPQVSAGVWRRIADLVHDLRMEVVWVPRHGKHPQWRAPAGWSTAWCREANKLADLVCSEQLVALRREVAAHRREWEEASRWCMSAVRACTHMVDNFKNYHDAQNENETV